MQKRIAIIVIIVLLSVLVSGCSHNNVLNVYSGQFVGIESVIENGRTNLVYDKDTHVMYYLVSNGTGTGITPYYTNEGKVGIYPDDYIRKGDK